MPSASGKTESVGSADNLDPLSKVQVLLEKKSRNLEKRKNKLINYKTELEEGKKLNDDQQRAVGAFDAVQASIDLCKELSVQISNVMVENSKLAKLQQKKMQEDKAQHELEKIKQVLKVQDSLSRLKQKNIRADFLAGKNGAIQLTEEKLKQLSELQKLLTPPLGPERDTTAIGFKAQICTSAERMVDLLDGRNKPAMEGCTYKDLRSTLYQVANCSYQPKKTRAPSVTSSPVLSEDTNKPPQSQPPPQQQQKKQPQAQLQQTQQSPPLQPQPAPLQPHNQQQVEQIHQSKTKKRTKPVIVNGTGEGSDPTPLGIPKKDPVPTQPDAPPQATPSLAAPRVVQPQHLPSAPTINSPSPVGLVGPQELTSPASLTAKVPKRRGADPAPMEGPPGIAPARVTPPEVLPVPTAAPTLPPVGASPLGPPHAFMGAGVDLNELMTSGSFNFLQESQVGPEPPQPQPSAVYVDPAVVSFGSVKPEGLVHLHEQQQKRLAGAAGVPSPQRDLAPPQPQAVTPVAPIQTETFINSAFSSGGSPGAATHQGPTHGAHTVPRYTPQQQHQTLPTAYTPPAAPADPGLPPAPIPLPTEKVVTPPQPTFESTSWAAQEEAEGWGAPEPPSPGGGPLNGGESWGALDEGSAWDDGEKNTPHGGMSHDMMEDRRSGGGGGAYRGNLNRGRGGGRGNMGGGGYRGGRGGYNSYQSGGGRGGFMGNGGYNNRGGRGGPSSNGGGLSYRGRGGFSRGGRGSEGNSRGIGAPRGRGYQGNQGSSGLRNQY